MQTNNRTLNKLVASLLLIVALFGSGLSQGSAHAVTGVDVDLCATAGSITLPASPAPVSIMGYALGDCSSVNTVTTPGGPTITVNEGDILTVHLHNNLSVKTGLFFQGQSIIPDHKGTSTIEDYTFTASHAGTYLYEAALLPNSQYQVAMGLVGVLVVNSNTSGQAYGSPVSAYSDSAVILLSELDTNLNNSAAPATFDMRNYHPNYWLINGRPYPGTDPIAATPGNSLLLRYVNAGMQPHSMSLLGLNQRVVAVDGSPFTYARNLVAQTLAPGETMDAITVIPSGAPIGSTFALYDASLMQHNNNDAGFGGMLAIIQTGQTAVGADTTGPTTGVVTINPSPAGGSVSVVVSAPISDILTGNANVDSAEFFIDTVSGTAIPMLGTYGSPVASATATLSIVDLAGISSGKHTIFVHGRDSLGNWGAFNFGTLNLDKAGPVVSALTLVANPANGSADVSVSATANDSAFGNSNVATAEFTVDGGAPTAMGVNTAMPIASITGKIPAAIVSAPLFVEGNHTISVRAQDALGNWGNPTFATLKVDRTGPSTSSIVAYPNPNNGTVPFNTSTPVVRVTASFSDALSNTSGAEAFIDTAGVFSSGTPFIAATGVFNSPSKNGYADFPLPVIKTLSQGVHTILVHARDSVGNWGPFNSATLMIDKLAPVVSGLTLSPVVTNNGAVQINASVSDVLTGNNNVTAAEYLIDSGAAAPGTGNVMTLGAISPSTSLSATIASTLVSSLAQGTHKVFVRTRDSLGNWSSLIDLSPGATSSATFTIDRQGPIVSGVSLAPTASNNTAVTISANANDTTTGSSIITAGEYFINNLGNAGTGTSMSAASATPNTTISATIPAVTISALSVGNRTIYIRARDAAGNWSTAVSINLLIDRSAPTLSGITLAPTLAFVGTSTVNLTVNGANDTGGSGVVGGEYWINPPTNVTPAPGLGTTFTGTSVSLSTAAFAAGSYTVSVRIRDAAGNWSTGPNGIRTTTLTVVTNAIFSDGFETGTFSPITGWTSRSTNTLSRLNISAGAALVGNFGLQVQGDNANYVQYNIATATGTYDARFYFNPNGNTSTGQDIFAAASAANFNTQLFHVRYRVLAGQPQVQIQVGATANAIWVNTTNASHYFEVVWQAGATNTGSLALYIDGVSAQSLTFSNTGTVGSIRLGSVTSGGSSVLEYFDAFSSKRLVTPLIGQ